MPLTVHKCPKCDKGLLWAKPLYNMFGRVDGYELSCPCCDYTGSSMTVEMKKQSKGYSNEFVWLEGFPY